MREKEKRMNLWVLLWTAEVINSIVRSLLLLLLSRKICLPIHRTLKNTDQIACEKDLFSSTPQISISTFDLKFDVFNVSQYADRNNLRRLIILLFFSRTKLDIFDMDGWYLFDKDQTKKTKKKEERRRDIFIGCMQSRVSLGEGTRISYSFRLMMSSIYFVSLWIIYQVIIVSIDRIQSKGKWEMFDIRKRLSFVNTWENFNLIRLTFIYR